MQFLALAAAGIAVAFILWTMRYTLAAGAAALYDLLVFERRQCSLCLKLFTVSRKYRGTRFRRVVGGYKLDGQGEATPVEGVVEESLCPECSKQYDSQMDDLMGGGEHDGE